MSHYDENIKENSKDKDAARPCPCRLSPPEEAAKPKVGKADGPPLSQGAQTRTPRGPFKTLTIPDCWYNSLHAASTTGGGADGKQE